MNKIFSIFIVFVVLSSSISAQNAGNEILYIPKTIKKAMVTALDWQLQNPKHVLTDWTNGAFYAGVFAAY